MWQAVYFIPFCFGFKISVYNFPELVPKQSSNLLGLLILYRSFKSNVHVFCGEEVITGRVPDSWRVLRLIPGLGF